jgi:anti-sigma-K factor RskA
MDKIENQEIIKKYVEGTLSPAEKQDIEQVLATDVALQKEVETYRALHFITRNQDLILASQTISAVIGKTTLQPDFEAYQAYLKPPSVKFWKKQWFWALSTGVVILLASIGVYQVKNKAEQARNAAIVAQFEPFENIVGLSSDDPSPFAQAMRLYDSGDFMGAKTILTRHYTIDDKRERSSD